MIDQEMAHQVIGSVEERHAHGGRGFSLLLAARDGSWASALARAQEEAAIEAQDALSQADEALVMG